MKPRRVSRFLEYFSPIVAFAAAIAAVIGALSGRLIMQIGLLDMGDYGMGL
jgi:hypothetical protein